MDISTTDPMVSFLKEELEKSMAILVETLRHILSCIHAERISIEQQSPGLQEILSNRQNLMAKFSDQYHHFAGLVGQLSEGETEAMALMEILEWLKEHLAADDMELLLLQDHLSKITREMQNETLSLLHHLEHKSALRISEANPMQRTAVRTSRITVKVADE